METKWEDVAYGQTSKDRYGSPLQCVTVEHLLTITDNRYVQGSPRNRAVWAYLAQLPPETKVALLWH